MAMFLVCLRLLRLNIEYLVVPVALVCESLWKFGAGLECGTGGVRF